jgi:hypothetical protein
LFLALVKIKSLTNKSKHKTLKTTLLSLTPGADLPKGDLGAGAPGKSKLKLKKKKKKTIFNQNFKGAPGNLAFFLSFKQLSCEEIRLFFY